jgi:hypothetical protein
MSRHHRPVEVAAINCDVRAGRRKLGPEWKFWHRPIRFSRHCPEGMNDGPIALCILMADDRQRRTLLE